MTVSANLTAVFLLFALLTPYQLQAEILTIPGTGDGTAVLRAVGAAFTRQHPKIQIKIPRSTTKNNGIKGSGGGIKAAASGRAVLARVARDIKAKEVKYGLSYQSYAKVPAVFFTTRDFPVSYLSSQQICDIFSGKINNWQAVGGPQQAIKIIRREEGDSTLSVLRKTFPNFDQVKIPTTAQTTHNTQENLTIVSQTAGSIGFGPYDLAINSNVQVIKIDGRDPTFSGYPSVTTLGFVFLKKNLNPAAQMFLKFTRSPQANLPIIVAGGIPID